MTNFSPEWTMIGLDVLMITYTLWVISLNRPSARMTWGLGMGMLAWLLGLHLALSNAALFPEDISAISFFLVIVGAVAAVGGLLFGVAPLRRTVVELDQRQLLLLQGVRIFFGAGFLIQASTGALPQAFGILDGFTHICAGFFGLIAAFSIAAEIQGARRAWFANLFGLADILAVASTLAFVLLPQIGPHHSMMYAVFLPAPLWLWFHALSIQKLLNLGVPVNQPVRA